MRGVDAMHDDAPVAELHATHDRLDTLDDRRVAAPVRRQRGVVVGVFGGVEVTEDVRTAEGVDGLLGIADEDQGAVAVERAAQDRPLGRVGVLELIDEHHPVGVTQPLTRLLAGDRVGQRIPQSQDQVVEGDQSPIPSPAQHLRPHRTREGEPGRLDAAVRNRSGVECRLRIVDRVAGDGARVGVRDRFTSRMRAAVLAHVEVVDHLVDQVRDALDEHLCGVGVGADPQAGQGMRTEGVGRRDRAGVEVGHGARQSFRRGLLSSGGSAANRATTSSSIAVPERRASRALVSASRTRSRNSRVALRPNVIISI